jgi:hypothetical protein
MDLAAPHDEVLTQKTRQTLRFHCLVPAKRLMQTDRLYIGGIAGWQPATIPGLAKSPVLAILRPRASVIECAQSSAALPKPPFDFPTRLARPTTCRPFCPEGKSRSRRDTCYLLIANLICGLPAVKSRPGPFGVPCPGFSGNSEA